MVTPIIHFALSPFGPVCCSTHAPAGKGTGRRQHLRPRQVARVAQFQARTVQPSPYVAAAAS
eukprot:gene53711-52614_t